MFLHKIVIPFIPFLTEGCICAFGGELSFAGNTLPVLEIQPPESTGLDNIYIVDDLSNVTLSYLPFQGENVEFYKYSDSGIEFAEKIVNTRFINNKYLLYPLSGDYGYVIKSGSKDYIFWLVDYSKYRYSVESFCLSDTQDCNSTVFDVNGAAERIYYFSTDGKRELLDREISLSYNNLVWNVDSEMFSQVLISTNLSYISDKIFLPDAVYCPTEFCLNGDRFIREWGINKNLYCELYEPYSIMIKSSVSKNTLSSSGSKITNEEEYIGGSAPCQIEFHAYITDGVEQIEWQISDDKDFMNLLYRIYERDFSHTFISNGTYYVRCVGSNTSDSCQTFGEVFIICIDESDLRIPNVFSPNGDGINDIWKVSYSSLLDFKCWIFDRNGHEVFFSEDPDKGWDGTRDGKTVNPGVYYYLIVATGTDGKRYKKNGDINIIRSMGNGNIQ